MRAKANASLCHALPKEPRPARFGRRAVAAAAWLLARRGTTAIASPSGVPLICCRLGLIQIVRDHAGKASHMHSGPKGAVAMQRRQFYPLGMTSAVTVKVARFSS